MQSKSFTNLREQDRQLLDELGLSRCRTLSSCRKRVNELRMRQLDKLKRMFVRLSADGAAFTPNMNEGIRRNDLEAFAQAALIVSHRESERKIREE